MYDEQGSHRTVVVVQSKSTVVGLLLGLFFGPLGLLYSSVMGAIVMFLVYIAIIILGFLTLGVGFFLLFLVHPLCAIWAAVAVSSHNKRQLNYGDESPNSAANRGPLLGLSLSAPAPDAALPQAAPQAEREPLLQPAARACPQCGGAVSAGRRFCGSCGHPMDEPRQIVQAAPAPPLAEAPAGIACPSCGMDRVPGKRFCKWCGAPAPAPAQSAPVQTAPVARAVPRAPQPEIPAPAATRMEPRQQAAPVPPPAPAGLQYAGAAPPTDLMRASFFEAAQHGNLGMIGNLLRSAPDLAHIRDEEQWTALHWAAGAGRKGIAELLLASGADSNAKALEDRTPLHFAAFRGHMDVVEVLLAYRAEINARTRSGETPLYVAALGRRTEVMEYLYRRGAEK